MWILSPPAPSSCSMAWAVRAPNGRWPRSSAELDEQGDRPLATKRAEVRAATTKVRTMSRSARVLALANQKGGVAKTTTTLNLGVGLHDLGARVLAIDLDPQSNLSMSQGIEVETLSLGMYDVLTGRAALSEIVETREIDIAPAGIELAGAELALSAMIGRERALERALRPVRKLYDYILIDTPPSLGLLTVNAMVAADGVVVPVQCEYLSLRGLAQLRETLSQVRENLNPRVDIVGILPTMYDGRTIHGREAVQLLEESFGDRVYRTRIGKTIRFAEAPVEGKSVLRYDPQGQAARWYRRLAREVWEGPMGMAGQRKAAA
jgi:chromosome partitioning protein